MHWADPYPASGCYAAGRNCCCGGSQPSLSSLVVCLGSVTTSPPRPLFFVVVKFISLPAEYCGHQHVQDSRGHGCSGVGVAEASIPLEEGDEDSSTSGDGLPACLYLKECARHFFLLHHVDATHGVSQVYFSMGRWHPQTEKLLKSRGFSPRRITRTRAALESFMSAWLQCSDGPPWMFLLPDV